MGTKKLIGAMAAAFVIPFMAGFLVHNVWLGTTYRQMREAGFSFRPEDAMRKRLWGVWVSDALYSILFVWVLREGERRKALGRSRDPLPDFDDPVHRCAVRAQRLYCLESAAFTGVALDDRCPDYFNPDGRRRRCNPEEIQYFGSLISPDSLPVQKRALRMWTRQRAD